MHRFHIILRVLWGISLGTEIIEAWFIVTWGGREVIERKRQGPRNHGNPKLIMRLIQVERLLVTTLPVLCYRPILLFRILILYREVGYPISLSATAQPSLLFVLQLLRRLLSILLLSSNMTLMNPTLLPVITRNFLK
jgi:hypothetical protein